MYICSCYELFYNYTCKITKNYYVVCFFSKLMNLHQTCCSCWCQ